MISPPDTVGPRYSATLLRSPEARERLDTQPSIGEAMAGFDAHERRLLGQLAATRGIRSRALNSFRVRDEAPGPSSSTSKTSP
ncbi:hypothetical protein [Streptomyces sp. 058-1L]|uniref:hypothetical protein n=1 Tax=Streptomyces sp. 058-1L TaxID=2789266 RepID=UPI00397FC55C